MGGVHDARKHRVSTSPSFPVAVSGSVSPSSALMQMSSFWSRHHCLVHERHGLDWSSGSDSGSIV